MTLRELNRVLTTDYTVNINLRDFDDRCIANYSNRTYLTTANAHIQKYLDCDVIVVKPGDQKNIIVTIYA